MPREVLRSRRARATGLTQAAKRRLCDLGRDRSGATAIEYGIICAVLTLGIVGAITYVGGGTNGLYGRLVTNMPGTP